MWVVGKVGSDNEDSNWASIGIEFGRDVLEGFGDQHV